MEKLTAMLSSYPMMGEGRRRRKGDTERMDGWGVKKEGYAALPILAIMAEPESGIPLQL